MSPMTLPRSSFHDAPVTVADAVRRAPSGGRVRARPGHAKPRVTCASPAACSLDSVVLRDALPGGPSLLVVASAGTDLLRDQPGAATDAAAVLALAALVDPVASQHLELVHGDLLISGMGWCRGPVASGSCVV